MDIDMVPVDGPEALERVRISPTSAGHLISGLARTLRKALQLKPSERYRAVALPDLADQVADDTTTGSCSAPGPARRRASPGHEIHSATVERPA